MDGSSNGWFLVVQSGQLIGYFSTAVGDQAIYAASATLVADGFWHHAALTVDTNGGTYLDGSGLVPECGPVRPARRRALDRFQIFTVLQPAFLGTIDEVALRNRALSIAEVNYLHHRTLNGNEDGLVALWHFDEGAGTSFSRRRPGHGYTGLLVGHSRRVTSPAHRSCSIRSPAMRFGSTASIAT